MVAKAVVVTQERSLDAPACPLGCDSKIHPQDECHMEESRGIFNFGMATYSKRATAAQNNRNVCSIQKEITDELESLEVPRPPTSLPGSTSNMKGERISDLVSQV